MARLSGGEEIYFNEIFISAISIYSLCKVCMVSWSWLIVSVVLSSRSPTAVAGGLDVGALCLFRESHTGGQTAQYSSLLHK